MTMRSKVPNTGFHLEISLFNLIALRLEDLAMKRVDRDAKRPFLRHTVR